MHKFARSLLVALSLLSSSGAFSAGEQKIDWKMPTAFAFTWPALGDTAPWFSERLEASSSGNIVIRAYEPGKLVPPLKILESVKNKTFEAGYTSLVYDQDKIPAGALFGSVPFGLDPMAYMAWWYDFGGSRLAEQVYAPHNIVPMLCGLTGPEGAGWFREEIKSVDQLKGLRVRYAGLGGEVLKRLGATVVPLAGNEIYPALEKGTLDATEYSMPAIDELIGFQKILKNYYLPGWHQPYNAMHLIVNKELWDKLGASQKAAIESTCMAATMRSIARGEAAQAPALTRLKAQGVQLRRFPASVMQQFERKAKEVMDEKDAQDPMFRKVHENQTVFVASYGLWKEKAYLPACSQ